MTEALTQEALKALDKAKKYNQPFYLYMSHYAIHVPIDKDVRFYDKYKKKGMTDHEAAYAELGSQAISYTTGVPAMIGAMMMVTGKWMQPGVWNMEQLDPDPFMEQLNLRGLPWVVQE